MLKKAESLKRLDDLDRTLEIVRARVGTLEGERRETVLKMKKELVDQARDDVCRIIREKGQDCRSAARELHSLEDKLVQTWKKYQKDKTRIRTEFLKISEKLVQAIKQERRTTKKLNKLMEPHYKKLNKLGTEYQKMQKLEKGKDS